MARLLRRDEGAFYHITARGNEGKGVFFSKSDYEKFKAYPGEPQDKYGHVVHGYILMNNHLLIETRNANMSRLVRNPVSNGAKTIPDHLSGLGMDTPYRIWLAMADAPATAIAILEGKHGNSIHWLPFVNLTYGQWFGLS